MSTTTTEIAWTDRTWNPVRGCSRVSEGCRNCYAERVAARFSDEGLPYYGLAYRTPSGPHWTGRVELIEKALTEPLSWRKPARVFVNSMSDLFHEALSDEAIDRVFATMAMAPRHTFQILTKRPERMRDYIASERRDRWQAAVDLRPNHKHVLSWPLPNVWLGVSCEDQATADARIQLLLRTPAAVRFISAEPLLAEVDLTRIAVESWAHSSFDALTGWPAGEEPSEGDRGFGCVGPLKRLDWVIVGGESGPGARQCNVAWLRAIVQQCNTAGVPAFVKQLGSNVIDRNDAGFEGDPDDSWMPETRYRELTSQGWQGDPVRIQLRDRKGGGESEWPADLRVRSFPEMAVEA